ncbi:LON peptidase substrate-binding domain-containing protein [Gordonia jinhuaensis]|nr:LON peptidase substrate-binding domain-containing protein [Gordonia jinhuaensis]
MTPQPMFPLGSVLLPGEMMPLRVFEPRYRTMVAQLLAAGDANPGREPGFGVVLIERGFEVGGGDVRTNVGTWAHIVDKRLESDGRAMLLCQGISRFEVTEWLDDDPFPLARIAPYEDTDGTRAPARIYDEVALEAEELFDLIVELGGPTPEPLTPIDEVDDPTFAWAMELPMGEADRYAILAARSPIDRLTIIADAIATAAAGIQFRLGEQA